MQYGLFARVKTKLCMYSKFVYLLQFDNLICCCCCCYIHLDKVGWKIPQITIWQSFPQVTISPWYLRQSLPVLLQPPYSTISWFLYSLLLPRILFVNDKNHYLNFSDAERFMYDALFCLLRNWFTVTQSKLQKLYHWFTSLSSIATLLSNLSFQYVTLSLLISSSDSSVIPLLEMSALSRFSRPNMREV